MPIGTTPTNDFSFYKGEDVTIPFIVESDLTNDITGWTVVMTIKDNDNAPTTTVTVNGAVTDGPNRLFQVVIPAATMAGIAVGNYLCDVWRTNAGFAWVLSTGAFVVKTERRVATP